ncbi:calcium-dependent protein kinase CDPK3 [Pelomyxa schiedti]|nr:calcium-dependent protein kinase CDPK3 [Pelomyxa schiedti]
MDATESNEGISIIVPVVSRLVALQGAEYLSPRPHFTPVEFKIHRGEVFRVGRHPTCQVVLSGECIHASCFHFEIQVSTDGEATLQDTSSHGTHINGTLATTSKHVIQSGSLISVPMYKDPSNESQNKELNFLYVRGDSAQPDLGISGNDPMLLKYDITNVELGCGNFGRVFLAHTREASMTRKLAVKIIEVNTNAETEAAIREIFLLTMVPTHKNLLRGIEFYQRSNKIFIFSDKAEYNLVTFMQKYILSEHQVFNIFFQIIAGLSNLHRNNILHRDLKPDNILVFGSSAYPSIRIADFGLAKKLEMCTLYNAKSRVGTLKYTCPEVLLSNGRTASYSFPCDLWSCGVILYTLLTGFFPFDGLTEQIIMDRIIAGTYDWAPSPSVSPSAKRLVAGLLRTDPHTRYTITQVLNDEWISTFQLQGSDSSIDKCACELVLRQACDLAKEFRQV